MMKHVSIKLIGVLMLGLALGTYSATASESPMTDTVEIDKEVHFLTPKGEDVVVAPGDYGGAG